jgi:hypothetical protein
VFIVRDSSSKKRQSGDHALSMCEAFIADAEASAAKVDAGGALYRAEDVHAYIRARAAGKPARRPTPARRLNHR